MTEEEERQRIRKAAASLTETFGAAPAGWYCRTAPSVNTRRLLVEHGGFSYDSDAYNDDLPYWTSVPSPGGSAWHLVVPYTLCTNDSKFAPGRAFSTADDFFCFMRDALDALLEEARETGRPKMMSVGLHMRLIGHPARIKGLHRFLDYVKALGEETVWVCRRIDIANHWRRFHPPAGLDKSRGSGSAPRLLVTGGAGFVLCNLVHHWLTCDGESTCVIFDLQQAWDREVQALLEPFLLSGRLDFYSGDVSSSSAWEQLLSMHGAGFTHVVAGAAVTPTPEEEKDRPEATLRVNLDGLLQCLQWARRNCPSLQRIVHVSSDAVLGAMSEEGSGGESLLPPMSVYALSKLTGEAVVQRWRELFSMDIVSVRFSDVYGRLDRDTGARNRHNAPYWVCRQICDGEPVRVLGQSLDELGWDYVDAPSVARGLRALLLASARPAKAVYHLALGRCVTHRELVDSVRRARTEVLRQALAACGDGPADRRKLEMDIGSAPQVEFLSSPSPGTRKGLDIGSVSLISLPEGHWLRKRSLDVAPMQREFAWEATPLEEAMAEYVTWMSTGSA